MDIYKARELQKELYKASSTNFKRMRSRVVDGVFYYLIFHRKSTNQAVEVEKIDVQRYLDDLYRWKIEVTIQYYDNSYNIPEGQYIIEWIPVG